MDQSSLPLFNFFFCFFIVKGFFNQGEDGQRNGMLLQLRLSHYTPISWQKTLKVK